MNYFELYGLPVSFQVNQGMLAKKYHVLIRQYHPDLHLNATEAIQSEMLIKTSNVNAV